MEKKFGWNTWRHIIPNIILIVIVSTILVSIRCSCVREKDYDYTFAVTYRVYYPGNTITKTYSTNGLKDGYYETDSYEGTNRLIFNPSKEKFAPVVYVESTTAPIEIVSTETYNKH